MLRDQIPAKLLELARQHGIDLDKGVLELNDADLEAVLGGKAPVGDSVARGLGGAIGSGIGMGIGGLLGGKM